MDELNACTECGFTTTVFSEFQGHIEKHENEHSRSSSGEMSNSQTIEWGDGIQSSTPSPRSTPPSDPTPSPDSDEHLEHHISITEITNTLIKKEPGTKGQKTVHVCPHCNFTTCMSQHMKSHLEAHERHQGQMYQCDICKMQFSQKANMHRHRMRHSGVKPYECRFCKKRFFRKDQMQEHSMTHIKTGFGFDCPVSQCNMQFSQHNALRAHLEETHTISSTNPASCKRCNLMFANSRRLLLHFQTRHDDSESSPKKENTPKRKKLSNGNALPMDPANMSITEQLQRMVKSEFSPPNTDTSDNSTSSEFDKIPPSFPMANPDILLMCLNQMNQFNGFGENIPRPMLNIPNIPLPALHNIPAVAAIVKQDQVQLWSEQTSSSVSVSAPSPSEQSHSPPANESSLSLTEKEKSPTPEKEDEENVECCHCGMMFYDNTMYLLHKSLHSDGDPFKCALCGTQCGEKYMFTTHVIFADHSTQATTSA
ncbi:Zinc finger protein ztf-16 [Caenorhabditis elegans]|uniref:Zinc finger protein ztf-16 n=1 Tax=Caenorhabditis elegans TaxID=6239 RepID=ZTF16_CAEEL|nr:Zinc finger protein ztf-16 [Caenorhabditis elegans]H2L008.1 RecName: Full=Zinc finger protein ztf-16 [Caenorhabditis elegans]CCD70859.1 Zinc finger protein ztf-16 [Caenorhabditis elegans]|eukprot:NP_001024851.1 Zinc finger putative Transcription Factor family [Caenorhabditis elegans]